MRDFQKIIFVAKSGNCRAPMAMELLRGQLLWSNVEIAARGLVVLFPEPLNQKAEAVMISNGIKMEDFMSQALTEEDFSETTLIIPIDKAVEEALWAMYPQAQNVSVLTDITKDELEIMNPYGGDLVAYGICFETMVNTIKKLAMVLNEGDFCDKRS